ncbi:MAE_28990/MAE_18760 family HEPN-like nuclease [Azospirillum melinis]
MSVSASILSLEDAKDNFDRRKKEVTHFFQFVELVFNKKPDLSFGEDFGDNHAFTRRITKMLLANGYLVIYNLVEATMTNLLDAIHVEVCSVEGGFERLRKELQILILKRLRDRNLSELEKMPERIGRGMVQYALDTAPEDRKVFRGNVDARKIKEASERYGFSFEIDYEATNYNGGKRLVLVKSWRNKLAHGSHSFVECGDASSVDELKKISMEAISYLECVMAGVEKYISQKEYVVPI